MSDYNKIKNIHLILRKLHGLLENLNIMQFDAR